MKKYLSMALVMAAVFFAGNAVASDGFAGGVVVGGYAGYATAASSSNTAGGSMASAANEGNGLAVQGAFSEGGGYASAGGHIDSNGVTTWTDTGSHSLAGAGGFAIGDATGNSAGAVGTDNVAEASGEFVTGGFGIGFGGFVNGW